MRIVDLHYKPSVGPVAALLLVALLLAGCGGERASRYHRVEIDGEDFRLELATTPSERYQGLSGREVIPEDGGMLFVFPYEAEQSFVMRNCPVPIDIIFLGPTGRVLATHAMRVEPPETRSNPSVYYRSGGRALFAIELAGGSLERLNVERGERIDLPVLELKREAE